MALEQIFGSFPYALHFRRLCLDPPLRVELHRRKQCWVLGAPFLVVERSFLWRKLVDHHHQALDLRKLRKLLQLCFHIRTITNAIFLSLQDASSIFNGFAWSHLTQSLKSSDIIGLYLCDIPWYSYFSWCFLICPKIVQAIPSIAVVSWVKVVSNQNMPCRGWRRWIQWRQRTLVIRSRTDIDRSRSHRTYETGILTYDRCRMILRNVFHLRI